MKSNIFKSMAVVVTAIIAGYNVYLAQAESYNEMPDLLLANVEALSQDEEGGGGEAVVTCSETCRDGIGQCWTTHSQDERYCERSPKPTDYCSCAHLPGAN